MEGEEGRADSAAEKVREEEEKDKKTETATTESDLDFLTCCLQPLNAESDSSYVGIRRLLLYRKSRSGLDRRKNWKCNGRSYVAYRNYIRRPRNWESLIIPSQLTTPNHSGRWAPSASPISLLFDVESLSSSKDFRIGNTTLSHRTSFGSSASDADHPLRFSEPAYSFVGMHCIFDNCKASVTVLKFGHMRSDLLAYGASDGSLTVCTVTQPPSMLQQLRGHSKDVTDFDFSSNNQYIASSSVDKTVRVWDITKGHCIRVIYGVSSQLCIRFHPVNNNFLFVGNGNKEITVINFSTGRFINKAVFENEVTAMDNDHTGQIIFCGDSQGCIYTIGMNSHTGALSRTHRHRSSNKRKSPITTVQYRTFSLLARGPVLLVCAQDGSLSFFSIALEIQGYLTLRCSLKLAPRVHNIHASFCPLLSLEKGEFIDHHVEDKYYAAVPMDPFSGVFHCLLCVSGSEDSNVYFYDLTKPKHTCVNKLQGHGSPVIGVAWNHGENFLASSDSDGMVIVWKRAKNG